MDLDVMYASDSPPLFADGEAAVAVHLPVFGQAVQRDHRAGREGRQPSSQLLLLHQDRHGRQGEEMMLMCTKKP